MLILLTDQEEIVNEEDTQSWPPNKMGKQILIQY